MAASLPMFTGKCQNNRIADIHLSKLKSGVSYFVYNGKLHKSEPLPEAMPFRKRQDNNRAHYLLFPALPNAKDRAPSWRQGVAGLSS